MFQQNKKNAILWIDLMLQNPPFEKYELSKGVHIINSHLFLETQKERLINGSISVQYITYYHIKKFKTSLEVKILINLLKILNLNQ